MYLYINTEAVGQAAKACNMSRQELATKSGVSMYSIGHLFSCRYKRVHDLTLEALAGAVGLPAGDLTASRAEVESYLQELQAEQAEGGTGKKILKEIRNTEKVLKFHE